MFLCLVSVWAAGCETASGPQPDEGIVEYRYANRTADTVVLEGYYTEQVNGHPVSLVRTERIAPGEMFTERKDDSEREAPLMNRCEHWRLEFGGYREIWYFRWTGIWKMGNPFLTDHFVPEPMAGGTAYRYEIVPELAGMARDMQARRGGSDPYSGGYDRLPGAVRLATYNVRYCQPPEMAIGVDYDRTAEVIRAIAPDAVALQELDSMTRRNMRYQLGVLAARTGLVATYGSTFDYLDGKFGNGILSAEVPLRVYNNELVPSDMGFGSVEPRKFLVAEFNRFVLIATHFDYWNMDYNVLAAQRINAWVCRHFAGCAKPVFLAGDFNEADQQAPPMRLLATMWETVSPTGQPTYIGEGKSLCIDYIMRWRGNGAPVRIAGAAVPHFDGIDMEGASDHLPVIVDVEIDRT